MKQKKLLVIDGNSLVNRAYYGVRPLSTRDGLFTNAIFGFLNILLKLREEEAPDALCVTFDRRAPTFRHLKYEGYKAQRKGMPEELAMQMDPLKDVLRAMNIPLYEMDGWEADDLIGTIARLDTQAEWATVVVTGDKDSLQLVSDTVTVLLVSTRMGQTTTRAVTPASFQEEYGFPPEKMVDLKALMGDASDNIPGVTGIGEKTALDLLRRYGSLDALYEDPDALDVKPGVRKKLAEGKEQAALSFDLATIRCTAPLEFSPEDARCVPWDGDALYRLLLRLEFTKLIDRLGLTPGEAAAPAAGPQVPETWERVRDQARAEELLARLSGGPAAVLLLPDLTGAAVSAAGETAVLLEQDLGAAYEPLLRKLLGADVPKVTHELKELCALLLEKDLPMEGFVGDTALMAYLLSPTDGSYALDKLAVSYLGQELPAARLWQEKDAFAPLADQSQAEGAFAHWAAAVSVLYQVLLPRLKEEGMEPLLRELELPLCPVLAEMEQTGFLVDRKALEEFGHLLTARIDDAQAAIYEMAGEQFNINSTQQLGVVLFEKLGLPPVKKTKTGYSTSAEVLEKLRDRHPMIPRILEYRQLTKLRSTYVDGLGKVIAPDGRIHTRFQNTVTATGRLSSMEPNLQNIPVRTELGAEMRKMFLAPKGRVLVDADYSQIELRLLAHIADDGAMLEAFRSGADIHTATAAQVFRTAPEQVTPLQRRSAKAVNFGIVYGISPFSLSQDIGVTVAEAKDYMDRYFETYHGVRAYMDRVVEEARERGFVATLRGRRRYLPELKSSNFNMRAFGERVALNAPIQGTAADIIKEAMIRVRDALRERGYDARLVLQVHDELIVEAAEDQAEQVRVLLESVMEQVARLKVDLLAEAAVGRTWYEAKA